MTMLGNRIRTFAALAVMASALVVGDATGADASATYASNGFQCNNGQIVSLQPRMTSSTGQLQNVYHRAALVKWDGSRRQWVTVATSRVLNAVAGARGVTGPLVSSDGRQTYWFEYNGRAAGSLSFSITSTGHYTVYEYLDWEGGPHVEGYTYRSGTTSQYCTYN